MWQEFRPDRVVLAADTLSLSAVLLIHFTLPRNSRQDGEALFCAGLLLAGANDSALRLTLVFNVIYLFALGRAFATATAPNPVIVMPGAIDGDLAR